MSFPKLNILILYCRNPNFDNNMALLQNTSNIGMPFSSFKETLSKNEKYIGCGSRKVTKCSHLDAPYYAKGMCRNCYH